jgi:hypothetical protein
LAAGRKFQARPDRETGNTRKRPQDAPIFEVLVEMTHPYAGLPAYSFWRNAVAELNATEVDPVVDVPFQIDRSDRVATAGSCFAQHISRTLVADGFNYFVTEASPGRGAVDESYGVFPARFGNLYTVRQLLQLFQRAYGLFEPADVAWPRADGAFVDPFRPRIQSRGFATRDELIADREAHLAAVRRMFEQCDIFIFTLGLTEGWRSKRDGAVFPLAPGVSSLIDDPEAYEFHNFDVAEMTADLLTFIDWLRRVNEGVRILLTVSPVALVATYEPRHVLTSTTYSKAALRVVADAVARAREGVSYFPSYEIITGPQARGRFFEADLREVTHEGVAHVMSIFRRHFLTGETAKKPERARIARPARAETEFEARRMEQVGQIVCDEEALDARAGG